MSAEREPLTVFEPHTVIEFDDVRQLHPFEDLVANAVAPNYNRVQWAGRPNLKNLIRPGTFNGNITNIQLKVLDYPIAQIVEARAARKILLSQEGKTFSKLPTLEDDTYDGKQYDGRRYLALSLEAEGRSGARTVGTIATKLWYFPNVRGSSHNSTGKALRRFMTRPELRPGAFEAFEAQPRHIGFEVLQEVMSRPIGAPHRG